MKVSLDFLKWGLISELDLEGYSVDELWEVPLGRGEREEQCHSGADCF